MPSAMIHLATARKYINNEAADIAYYVGALAPDSVSERSVKDHTHLRDRDSGCRHRDLARLARVWELSDPFVLGALLHLFTDMCWDEGPQSAHKASYSGEDWFHDYRAEISYASGYMFHHTDWGERLWARMESCPRGRFSALADYPPEMIEGYLVRNGRWHRENDTLPSSAFPPGEVERFCADCAERFGGWLDKIKKGETE